MLPAETLCPPKTFTPSRCPAESLPLRDAPPAFLCAMFDYPFSKVIMFYSPHHHDALLIQS
jgi:hypothetical protein